MNGRSVYREGYNRGARVYSGDSPHKRAGARRRLDDCSAPGHSWVLKRIAEVLNVPFSRIQTNLESYANTAGATVPLLLDQVNRRGLLRAGDLLLLVSIGAGWTWGASLYRW